MNRTLLSNLALAYLALFGCATIQVERELYLYEETDHGDADSAQFAEFLDSNDDPYALLGTLILPGGESADGGLLVEDGRITELWRGPPPDHLDNDIVVISTGGIIAPGFIDLHNHVAYNFLPFWHSGKEWRNRYHWAGASAYKNTVKPPYNKAKAEVFDEANKWGELRALIGGTTSIQGAPARNELGFLVRNIDHKTLGSKLVRTWVAPIETWGCDRGDCSPQLSRIATLKQDFDNGTTKALLVHVAEGKRDDEASQEEFQWLEDNDLVRPEVVIIHGTALGQDELEAMGQAQMGMVWSPRSNIELYGETTDVRKAKQEGVRIALAPDWSPSGSDNVLAELRYLAVYNEDELDCLFTPREMISMITEIPAQLAGRGHQLGRLEEGFVADLVVLAGHDEDPFTTVLFSDESDIRLVAVNGVPLYGWRSWLKRLGKEGDFSELRIRGRLRGLDTTIDDIPQLDKETQTFDEIRNALAEVFAEFGQLPELTANGPGPATPRPYCGSN
jgi:cytosine/adenosine deaminase-related metal-dependent hydrolase